MKRSQLFVALVAVSATLFLVGCAPATDAKEKPVSYADASSKQKASVGAALGAVGAATANISFSSSDLAYTSPDGTVVVAGTMSMGETGGTMNATITMDKAPDGAGSYVTGKITIKQTVTVNGESYSYTATEKGSLTVSGATSSKVSLDIEFNGSNAAVEYSGTITVDGTEIKVDNAMFSGM